MKPSIFLFLLLSLTIACNQPEQEHLHAGADADTPACHNTAELPAAEPAAMPDMSLYQLDSDWTSQEGHSMKLEALQGRIQLVAMIYTGCSYACPRIIADLKRIEESLAAYKRTEVGIVMITLDPARDTPEKLLEFAAKNKLDADRWLLLTSTESKIRELAALLNVRYKQESNMSISHSNIISVLNSGGELVHQQEGLGVDPDETVKAISQLLHHM